MSQPPPPDAKERILDAAESAFSEHGLAGARVAAIARDAEVNKAMLYYYFGSKDGLYRAVLERMADMIVAMAERAMTGSDAAPEQRLFSFIEGYRDLLTDHPSFLRIATRELLSGGDQLIPLFVARAPHILGTFWQCVREGQAAGTINPDLDFRAIMPVLLAPYIMFNVGSTVFGDRIPIDPEQVRSLFYDTAMAVARDGILRCSSEEVA
jgi:AcrR family transcriptional regulator